MNCSDCIEVKKLELKIQEVDNHVLTKDIEHETMIDALSTRMVNMEQKFERLEKEVKQDIKELKDTIPSLFKNAVNEMMAKFAKWIFAGLIALLLIIALSFTRPIILQALNELKTKVEEVEIGL